MVYIFLFIEFLKKIHFQSFVCKNNEIFCIYQLKETAFVALSWLGSFLVCSNSLFSQSLAFEESRNYFSPNSDGIYDTMIFNIIYPPGKKINNWVFSISDESGKTVRIYQAYHGLKKSKNILNYVFKDKQEVQPLYLPSKVEWLGTDNKGKLLPDGKYSVKMKFQTSQNEEMEISEKYFYLDSKKPIGKSTSEKRIFSPNNDKINDSVVINHYFDGEPNDRWKGMILNSQNRIVRSFLWDTFRLPKQILWDGKDDRGILQEEGLYKYRLQSEDFSENSFTDDLPFLQISNLDLPDIYPDLVEFSPNQDGIKDTIVFKLFLGSEKKIDDWVVRIVNLKKPEKYNWDYESSIPFKSSLIWDGRDKKRELLPDGEYSVVLEINPNSIKKQVSNKKVFTINTNEPKIKFRIIGDHFTPDGDGENDTLEVFPEVKNLDFKTWKVSIVETYQDQNKQERKKILKRWSGFNHLPTKLIWDGISDDGLQVSSLSNYLIYFSFRNELNESKIYTVKKFQAGILINQITKSDFKITIPEHVFRGKEDLIIKELKSIIPNLFPSYFFQLQSHSKIYGDNIKNKIKTEKRSKEVNEALFDNPKIKDKINFQGCGEIFPLFIEDDFYRQEKNDRIEILVSKSKRDDCYKGY
jgi:flagellar hook assembly protein FlgD